MRRLLLMFLCMCLLTGCAASVMEEPEADPKEMATTSDYIDRSNPPALHIQSGNAYMQGLSGTCSWMWKNWSGTWEGMDKDSLHPLSCQELLKEMQAEENQAALIFGAIPDSLTVRCWPDSQWNNTEAQATQIQVQGQNITLLEGAYIYEVVAKWEEKEGRPFHGTVYYCFYASTSVHT